MLEVGRVLRPHGVKGEVVVELVTNRPERVAPGSVLFAGQEGDRLEVGRARRLPGEGRPGRQRWLVSFAGSATREAAERLRGEVLVAPAIEDPSAMWVHDLIGASVETVDGQPLGVVEAVEANPASDLLVLGGGQLIPLRFVVERGSHRLTVNLPTGLLEL